MVVLIHAFQVQLRVRIRDIPLIQAQEQLVEQMEIKLALITDRVEAH